MTTVLTVVHNGETLFELDTGDNPPDTQMVLMPSLGEEVLRVVEALVKGLQIIAPVTDGQMPITDVGGDEWDKATAARLAHMEVKAPLSVVK